MKRYIVFLKQVPLSTKVDIDPQTKTLKRSSALTQTNPDDLHALQMAVDLSKTTGAEVVAVSMGPLSAEDVLREALQRGADRAVLLSSPAFAGSDTWCTSLVLSYAVRKIGDFDMLFFGRMAIDGDTAQVGPEVAGHLDIPQITNLINIEKVSDGKIRLYRQSGNVRQYMEVVLPCAIMAGRENSILEHPTLSGWRKAQGCDIEHWDERDLGLDASLVGLHASPTKVLSTSVPDNKKNVSWISDTGHLLNIINDNK